MSLNLSASNPINLAFYPDRIDGDLECRPWLSSDDPNCSGRHLKTNLCHLLQVTVGSFFCSELFAQRLQSKDGVIGRTNNGGP